MIQRLILLDTLELEKKTEPSNLILPSTCSFAKGALTPIPTLPFEATRILSVPAKVVLFAAVYKIILFTAFAAFIPPPIDTVPPLTQALQEVPYL